MFKKEENPAGFGNAFDIPFDLRANDVTRHLINVDSRFRTNGTTSDFFYRLRSPVRNILRLRVRSVEMHPKEYYLFSEKRHTVSLRIFSGSKKAPSIFPIVIPDGDYTPDTMVTTINAIITGGGLAWLSVFFEKDSGTFVFTGTQYFAVDTTYQTLPRNTGYGLGYYLGFHRKLYKAASVGGGWEVESDFCADFTKDSYVFLKINEFDCVSQQTSDDFFKALAKIRLCDPCKIDKHLSDVVFPNPQDLTRFHIQVLDAYGVPIDLCGTHFSFALEVLEVKNLTLYNTIRDTISLRYV